MAEPPEWFVDLLSSIVYTADNVERAGRYLTAVRRLDPRKLRYPWALSGPDPRAFERVREWFPPHLLTDCLFVPAPDLASPAEAPTLAGFGIRYCGPQTGRARFYKIKRNAGALLLYNGHEAVGAPCAVLTESAICAETVRQLGFVAVSPFGGSGSSRLAVTLHALVPRVLIAYDNDPEGDAYRDALLRIAALAGPPYEEAFGALPYRGGDPNDALTKFGPELLRLSLGQAIGP